MVPPLLDDLRPVCAALMSSGFSTANRLKAILQVAFELLGASSIVAYKYERSTERLEIFAMPGVGEREVMRGPTPEPIFDWGNAQNLWLEDTSAYEQYLGRVSPTWLADSTKSKGEGFRDRELRKHRARLVAQGHEPSKDDDLAMAKIYLCKGVGQTSDPVGQLFFNFYKTDRRVPVFSDDMKAAIEYVAVLERELLIQELYHGGHQGKGEGDGGLASLRLLRMVDEQIRAAKVIKRRIGARQNLVGADHPVPPDLRRRLHLRALNRLVFLEKVGNPGTSPRNQAMACRKESLQKLAPLLAESNSPLEFNDETRRELYDLIHQDLERDLWATVCRTAVSTVETYGGQADVVLVLGDRLVRRFGALDVSDSILMLDPNSISAFCIEKRKVFSCNNVLEKGSPVFKEQFKKEPDAGDYRSLMIVPVVVEGEARAVIRLMSSDPDCFLDRHALAVQDLAFAAGYALASLDAFERRDRISAGLAFFAEGQAVAAAPALPELLCEAARVLGANLALCWPAVNVGEGGGNSMDFFGRGLLVRASGASQPPELVESRTSPYRVRTEGLTHYIYRLAAECESDLLFCLHDLRDVSRNEGTEYILQIVSDQKLPWLRELQETPDGAFFKSDCTSLLPLPDGSATTIALNPDTPRFPHTQVGFAIKERGSKKVHAVVWFCCDNIHLLGWWERYFLQALSNYLAQVYRADDLQLAIKSFRHMLYNLAKDTEIGLNKLLYPRPTRMIGLPAPDDPPTALAKASDLIYMVAQKCVEVKALLTASSEPSVFHDVELGCMLHRAWAVATGLRSSAVPFRLTIQASGMVEEGLQLIIYYSDGARPDLKVTDALYTGAVNVLQNMKKHRKPEPFVAWASIEPGGLCVVFGDGGGDTVKYGTSDSEDSGTGLRISEKILSHVQGKIRRLPPDALAARANAPELLRDKCKTLFEIRVPLTAGVDNGDDTCHCNGGV